MAETPPQCHLCGRALETEWARARDIEYASVQDEYRYWHCRECDALSIDPLPDDRLAEIYPPDYYSFVGSGSPLEEGGFVPKVKALLDRRRFDRVLVEIERTPIRLVDVGGGSGGVAERIVRTSDRPVQATVIDIDPASIEVAQQRGLGTFLGRFEDFPADAQFDVVLMLNVIEHVADPLACLAKSRNLLAPGGLIYLQTPNFRSLDARLFRSRSWAGLHCPRHWVVFSTEGLRSALVRSGLRPTRLSHTQAGSFWAASLLGSRHRIPPPKRRERPLVKSPAYLPLAAAGAGFDFLTLPIRRTSQVIALATRCD